MSDRGSFADVFYRKGRKDLRKGRNAVAFIRNESACAVKKYPKIKNRSRGLQGNYRWRGGGLS